MLRWLLHCLLCLIVLVCPATGGRCCANGEGLSATVVVAKSCGSDLSSIDRECGCQHESDGSGEQSPPKTPSPCDDPCQTCLCGGALPVSVDSVEIEPALLAPFVFVPRELDCSLHRMSRFGGPDQYEDRAVWDRRMIMSMTCVLLL